MKFFGKAFLMYAYDAIWHTHTGYGSWFLPKLELLVDI